MKKYFINKHLCFMLIAIIMGAASQPMVAYAFISIDSIFSGQNIAINISNFYCEMIMIALAMIFASISHIMKNYISNIQMNNVRKDMFEIILNKKPQEFHKKDSGEYYNYVLKKVDAWQSGYYDQVWNMIQHLIELLCIFYLVFSMNTVAGFICIIILIPLIINNIFFPKLIGKSYGDYLEQDSKMVVKLKEFLSGFDIIKFNSAEKIYSRKMNNYFDMTNKFNQKICLLNNMSGTVANICVVLSQAGGIGIGLVLLARKYIGIGQFIALIQLLSYVNEPVIDLINSMVSFASIRNVNKELEGEISQKKYCECTEDICVRNINELRLDDITYKYVNKQEYIFNKFSFSFKKDKKYLVVGESGSGKSTLIKIIVGVICDINGKICIDSREVNELERYRYIGLVPQDIFIFDDSIRNNIDILNTHSDDEVKEVIEKVRLTKFVDSKTEGIYSKINEEVLQVSGGERARIGLARVLIENKPIIIFDEILSSLDNDNAYQIEKLIVELENKCIIHVAHKYSKDLVERYDQILDLNYKYDL